MSGLYVNKEDIDNKAKRTKPFTKYEVYNSTADSDYIKREIIDQLDVPLAVRTKHDEVFESQARVTVENLRAYTNFMEERDALNAHAMILECKEYAEKRDDKLDSKIDYYIRLIYHIVVTFIVIILFLTCLVCSEFDRLNKQIERLESNIQYTVEEEEHNDDGR